jgi:DNA repair protein RadC
MAITDWPENERPRERLLAQGAQVLSDAELLAIFLRTGAPGKSAVDVARDCLHQFEGLRGLFAASLGEFSTIKGLGAAKYAQLQAVFELSRRAVGQELRQGAAFTSPQRVRDYLSLMLGQNQVEVFVALFLDAQNRLICSEELFRGTLMQTAVYPREVVKRALAHHAAAVIFAHNHPSGAAHPSEADLSLTRQLKQALNLVDIRTLDHFIVAGPVVYSFAEHGQI